MAEPLQFQPVNRTMIDSVPIEVHNKLTEDYEALENELKRCRQKVAHLLKDKENDG